MSTSSTILGILPFSADAKSKYCIYDMGTKNISVYFDFKYKNIIFRFLSFVYLLIFDFIIY